MHNQPFRLNNVKRFVCPPFTSCRAFPFAKLPNPFISIRPHSSVFISKLYYRVTVFGSSRPHRPCHRIKWIDKAQPETIYLKAAQFHVHVLVHLLQYCAVAREWFASCFVPLSQSRSHARFWCLETYFYCVWWPGYSAGAIIKRHFYLEIWSKFIDDRMRDLRTKIRWQWWCRDSIEFQIKEHMLS